MKLLMDTAASTWSDAVPAELDDSNLWAPGTCVGSWRIERLLGMGGMSSVYAVTHVQIGKRAAMKVMHAWLSSGINAERVTLEGRVVNHVGHANVVDIFDSGSVAGRPYLVMERLDGMTLTRFSDGKRVPLRTAIAILLQLCDALAAAHEAGVVHRDLKPENIFVIDRGDVMKPHVKLLDWGIAKVLDDTSHRTIKGHVIGTPEYLSPEQACGKPVSPMTDVYALGVIAYELFVGELPFEADHPTDMLTAHHREEPRAPSFIWPEIPPRLAALLLCMLAKAPDERPQLDTIARELVLADAVLPSTRHAPLLTAAQRSSPHSHLEPQVGFGMFVLGLVVFAVFAAAPDHDAAVPASPPASAGSSAVPPVVVAPSAVEPIAAPLPATAPPAAQPRMRRVIPLRTSSSRRDAIVPRTVEAPPVPTTLGLVEHYVAVGSNLRARSAAIDVSDLWTRYRRIRIYDALPSHRRRADTASVLVKLEDAMQRRLRTR